MFVAACFIMFLVFGVHYTFGILYPYLLEEYQKGEQRTGKVAREKRNESEKIITSYYVIMVVYC